MPHRATRNPLRLGKRIPTCIPADRGVSLKRFIHREGDRSSMTSAIQSRHARLLRAPRAIRTGSTSTASGTRPSGPTCSARSRHSGRRNYSLFLRDDGLLIGYYETDDDAASQAALEADPRTAPWEAEMAGFFVALDGRPDQGATPPRRGVPPRRPARRARRGRQHPRPATTPAPRHPHQHRKQPPVTTIPADVLSELELQAIELPSWAFGNSGTRFKVFATPGTPRDPYEKIADAAQVHAYTALAPTVALHIPWDKVDSYDDLRRHAEDHGVALGTINSNTFQDDDYKFGALTHEDAAVRRKAIDHHFECIDIMHATGVARPEDLARRGLELPGPGRPARPPGPPARLARRRSTRASATSSASCSSTSSSSRRSTTPTFPTGARATPRSPRSATRRWSASTPATTRRARTSSSSSCSCCASASSARSTSTRASTPTTTSSWAPPTRSSCSASSSRSSAAAASTTPTSRSCSTSATTSRTRSPARSARC